MKVALITIYDLLNYGNRLQNYALVCFFNKNKLQADTIIIDYSTLLQYIKKCIKRIIHKPPLLHWNLRQETNAFVDGLSKSNKDKHSKFKKFTYLYTNIKYKRYIEPFSRDWINDYDYFIVGSDQVWNPRIGQAEKWEFLNFVPKNKRISYSASFGISEVPKECEVTIRDGLNGIPHISVREHAGAAIVKKLTGRDVTVLVDPTLLLSDEEWRSIGMRPAWYRDEKYILTYFLGDVPQVLDELAKEHNYKIYNLMDADNLNLYTSRVEEFLWLIDHAELVCTDSFHACVFSIIFNTPFVVVKRQQKGMADMTSRLDTLLGLFGYQNRLIDFVKYSIKADELLHMDFSKVKDIQKREIARSTEFLKKAMKME